MICAIHMYSRNLRIDIGHKTMVFGWTSLADIIEEFHMTFVDIFVEVGNKVCLLAIAITEVVERGMDLQIWKLNVSKMRWEWDEAYTGCN